MTIPIGSASAEKSKYSSTNQPQKELSPFLVARAFHPDGSIIFECLIQPKELLAEICEGIDPSDQGDMNERAKYLARIIDFKKVDEKGQTAEDIAYKLGDDKFEELLIRAAQFKTDECLDRYSSFFKSAYGDAVQDSEDADRLNSAVEMEDVEKGAEIVKFVIDVNKVNKRKQTALETAVKTRDAKMMELLVRAGADPNKVGHKGSIPLALHVAVEKRDVELVKLLLEAGADIKVVNEDNLTPTALAKQLGFTEIEKTLAEAASVTSPSAPPAQRGIIEQIHTRSAEASSKDSTGARHALRIVKQFRDGKHSDWAPLVEASVKGGSGDYLLSLAFGAGYAPIVKKVIQAYENHGITPCYQDYLFPAITAGNPNTLFELCRQGVDLNAQEDTRGETPLIRAIYCDNDHLAIILLKAGADANKCCRKNENTPMHFAAIKGLVYLGEFLLMSGAAPDKANKYGQTPFHLATANDNREFMEWLVEKNVDVNAHDKNGATALHIAVKQSTPATVNTLLGSLKANVLAVDNSQSTALHYVAEDKYGENRLDNAKVLMMHGANPHAANNEGKTPLGIAIERGDSPLVSVLQGNLRPFPKEIFLSRS